jgi:hypothetical protein
MAKEIRLSDKVEHWTLEKLIPYSKINARVHPKEQVEQIAASITEFGFTAPILVDDKNGILAGHGRHAAAKMLKMKKVPVIQLKHLNEIQRRAYMIADNKIPLSAQWDAKRLDTELKALTKNGYDLLLTGFSEEDIARLSDDLDEMSLRQTSAASSPPTPTKPNDSSDDEDEDEDDEESSAPSAPQMDMVTISFIVADKQRDFILETIQQCRAQHKLKNNGDALVKLCQQWKEQYDV